jgi:hypothetical protein
MDKMLRITRDKTELGDVPFVTFTVRHSPRDKTVCGTHEFDQHSLQKSFRFHAALHGLPVVQAFEETQRFAKSMGIWTIWINDSDRLLEMAQSQ